MHGSLGLNYCFYRFFSYSTLNILSGWWQSSLTASLRFKTLSISRIVAKTDLPWDSMLTAGMGFVKIRTIAVLLSLSLSSSFVLWWITPPDYSLKGNKIYSCTLAPDIFTLSRIVQCVRASIVRICSKGINQLAWLQVHI